MKKILKVVGVVLAISAAAAAVYLVVKKITDKKKASEQGDLESFVTCSCLDDEPILVEDQPAV
ncbi:MAG: hypothetical protein LBC83_01625 [Oscillospiraceae bacterium]|jgi:hypothetical protein|nr:hypothetical protein [Oscillospiraceae bacterium]